jgi:uncharacterized iron-regulated membrane protein
MTFRQRLLRQPQSLWIRKAVFQVHLWTGIGVGLYILVISLSGSAVVFRIELMRKFSNRPTIVASGERLTEPQLRSAAERVYPDYQVTRVWQGKNPKLPVDIWLERGSTKKQRLFDPYTGRDLGDTDPLGARAVTWFVDLHDDLLGGPKGRVVNGAGAVFLTLLCVTGAVIWWPGVKSWRRSLLVEWSAGWRRMSWDLHSAIGFWTFLFVLMWAVSGVYLVFPQPFGAIVDYLEPFDENSLEPRIGDLAIEWLAKLHFGRFGGWKTKTLWAVLGLVPAILFVTGAIMWWNRVVAKRVAPAFRRTPSVQLKARAAEGLIRR